jgi:response regulator RpfG family c-di-GMP phosphodiesterase
MAFSELDDLLGATSSKPGKSASEKGGAELPTVIAVDDDRDILRGIEGLFGKRYNLLLCQHGADALAALSDEICAVILDVRMAGMDGFAVCEKIRASHPNLPVIFYSAYQDSKDPYRIINDFRPFAYITKGDSIQKLVEAVDLAVRLQWSILNNQRLVARIKSKSRPPQGS